ncbi:hypothetical protein GN958_ATG03810, partial [Phytophthora infestans]
SYASSSKPMPPPYLHFADLSGSGVGIRVLRLYLGEQQAPDPLEQQRQEYQKAQREDEFETNRYLITLSLYEIAPDHPALPSPGSIIAVSPTKLNLYRNCWQVRATMSGITTVIEP